MSWSTRNIFPAGQHANNMPSDLDVAIQLPDAVLQVTSAFSLSWYDVENCSLRNAQLYD
jgi:hypothetical protein